MPTRYLKPGICDSKHIDSLSAEAECLYYRLLVNVDDFGRLDARPLIIKAKCYPLREKLKSSKVEKWLKELAVKGLAVVYICMDEPFLQMNKWDNKPRASHSKFPEFDSECIQMYTVVPLTKTETGTKTETKTVTHQSKFDEYWSCLPEGKKKSKGTAEKAWKKINPDEKLFVLIMEGLERAKKSEDWLKDGGQFVPHPATWLNGKCWEDEHIIDEESELYIDPTAVRIEKIKAGQEAGEKLFITTADGLVEVQMFSGHLEFKSDSSIRKNAYEYLKEGNVVQIGNGGTDG